MTSEKDNQETNGNGKGPGVSSLALRIGSALVLVPLALIVVYMGSWPLAGFLGLVGVIMAFEWQRLVLTQQYPRAIPGLFVISAASTLVCFYFATVGNWPYALVSFSVGTVLVLAIGVKEARDQAVWSAFALPYVVLPGLAFIWLRTEVPLGLSIIVWMLFVVWATDSGGYIAGRSLGGPKLAPKISPNKTWAGFFGGVALSMLMGAIAFLVMGESSLLAFLTMSAILSVVAQIGDLFESAMKRKYGVKDISSVIPGHGGVLDRMDGLLFVLLALGAVALVNDGKVLIWS